MKGKIIEIVAAVATYNIYRVIYVFEYELYIASSESSLTKIVHKTRTTRQLTGVVPFDSVSIPTQLPGTSSALRKEKKSVGDFEDKSVFH